MVGPGDLFAQIKARNNGAEESGSNGGSNGGVGVQNHGPAASLLSQIHHGKKKKDSNNNEGVSITKNGRETSCNSSRSTSTAGTTSNGSSASEPVVVLNFRSPDDNIYTFDSSRNVFLFFNKGEQHTTMIPTLCNDQYGNIDTDIVIPLAPCIYRMTDYTIAKKEPIALDRCLLKLNAIRCLQRECNTINQLLYHRLKPITTVTNEGTTTTTTNSASSSSGSSSSSSSFVLRTLEEDEIGKLRFMELLSNCGVYQKVSELILQRVGKVHDNIINNGTNTSSSTGGSSNSNPYCIPQIRVDGLDDFLNHIEQLVPTLQQARYEIETTQTVSFYPGLGELFIPGSKLVCHPDGMDGNPMGCSCVQSWYQEEYNKATNNIKRRFILVIEYIISVGDELVFVAATDVYPEFYDCNRNVSIKDLTHRILQPDRFIDDKQILYKLQQRGEFYANVSIGNHYLQYYNDSFYPIITRSNGGWNSNAIRPLSKGGRVMVDVKRGILEGHIPIRTSSSSSSADGMSDTVKEAIKLFEQSKRTGVAVPFRTCILPEFHNIGSNSSSSSERRRQQLVLQSQLKSRGDSDRHHLWQSWPILTGFSFTARVWGKLILDMPRSLLSSSSSSLSSSSSSSEKDKDVVEGIGNGIGQGGGEGGGGSCGNCGYIQFQEKAFEQLVLADEKKELIRAVARNAGGGGGGGGTRSSGNHTPTTNGDNGHAETVDDYDDDDDDMEDVGIDVVANKGGASIFLLYGPPGCGKTLTAEAIAELLRKPLYIVTAGDLGITAAEVEKELGSVLDLCQTWDALVLIDEADIFLEARNSSEIQRNALVCVMLRLLEYYSGCLFLSSNRAGNIDAAIASRITVMLGYPALDVIGRAKVWKNLIELVPAIPFDPNTTEQQQQQSIDNNNNNNNNKIIISRQKRKVNVSKYRYNFTDNDYNDLSTIYELNGRQIKNSIVLARALARERNTPLSLSVLKCAVTAVAGEGCCSSSAVL